MRVNFQEFLECAHPVFLTTESSCYKLVQSVLLTLPEGAYNATPERKKGNINT